MSRSHLLIWRLATRSDKKMLIGRKYFSASYNIAYRHGGFEIKRSYQSSWIILTYNFGRWKTLTYRNDTQSVFINRLRDKIKIYKKDISVTMSGAPVKIKKRNMMQMVSPYRSSELSNHQNIIHNNSFYESWSSIMWLCNEFFSLMEQLTRWLFV